MGSNNYEPALVLIFNMGIPILGKDGLYIESGPKL